MEKEGVEKIIRSQFRQNFQLHPECFPDQIIESILIAKETAKGFWNHRSDKEIDRAVNAKVTAEDYKAWIIAELVGYKKLTLYN